AAVSLMHPLGLPAPRVRTTMFPLKQRRWEGRKPFYRFFAAPFAATAAFTRALNAFASIVSPSWMSIALRVLPSRLELKSRLGSGRLAPRAKVSFTTFLYVSPVQTIPLCD